MSPVELAIISLLIAAALVTAWRFLVRQGWIAGPVLMVVVLIEVAKRLTLAIQGVNDFDVFDAVLAAFIIYGLATGINSARTMRKQK